MQIVALFIFGLLCIGAGFWSIFGALVLTYAGLAFAGRIQLSDKIAIIVFACFGILMIKFGWGILPIHVEFQGPQL